MMTLKLLAFASVVALTWTGLHRAEPPAAAPPEVKPNPCIVPAAHEGAHPAALHEQFNARAKQGAEKGDIGVIFLGDSITEAWSGPGKAEFEKRFAAMGAVNFGIGGDRTQHVLWRLDHGNVDGLAKPAAGKPPKAVMLMIGTNNMGDSSPEEIGAGVGAIVAKLHEKLPGTKVLLLGIFPRSEKPDAMRTKVLQTNRLLAKLGDGQGTVYFDFGNRFLEIDGTISKEIMPDSLHLSPAGYTIWSDAVEAKLRAMVGG